MFFKLVPVGDIAPANVFLFASSPNQNSLPWFSSTLLEQEVHQNNP